MQTPSDLQKSPVSPFRKVNTSANIADAQSTHIDDADTKNYEHKGKCYYHLEANKERFTHCCSHTVDNMCTKMTIASADKFGLW